MIEFPPQVQSALQKKQGQEIVLLLEVDWVDGSTITYSDAEYPGAQPYLVSTSNIDRRDLSSTSTSIDVVMDATNDPVNQIFESYDIHLRPVRLYLGFPNVAQKALLFDGVINSVVEWDDEARTLSFQVLSRLEDAVVGFSMEDGFFPLLEPEDRGTIWPLPFGTVCNYPAARLGTAIKGYLTAGVGAVDPTIPNRLCQIKKTTCPFVSKFVNLARGNAVVKDPNCLARRKMEECVLRNIYQEQLAASPNNFRVRGGEKFPQNQTITIRIGSMYYIGKMSGDLFQSSSAIHPDADKIRPCLDVRDAAWGYRNFIADEDEASKCDPFPYRNSWPNPEEDGCTVGVGPSGNAIDTCAYDSSGRAKRLTLAGGSADSWKYFDGMPTGRFIWNPAGTTVELVQYSTPNSGYRVALPNTGNPGSNNNVGNIVYIASLVPGVVTSVTAYRKFGDVDLLTQVPTDWYDVVTTDYGGYQAVEIRMNRLPSSRDGEGWSDEIFVSFQSSVGPNPVDIIEWILNTYTDYTIDSTNFAAVATKVAEFPCNFVLFNRPNVLSLVKDIAYQSRLAVRIVNNEVSLVYLAEEPTSIRTIDASDIVSTTFNVEYTRTEDLETNQIIKWRNEYTSQEKGAQDNENEYSIRFNVPKYGNQTREYDWYTQTNFEVIEKCATFWLIRKSQTWLMVTFETSIEHLDLDIFDSITLDFDRFNIKVVLDEKQYNTDTNTVTWRAWVPIRAGENSQFLWAWPATVASGKWPIAGEEDLIGSGTPFDVIAPLDHPLRLGKPLEQMNKTSGGDSFPSDVGFSAPVVECISPLGNEIKNWQAPSFSVGEKAAFQADVEDKQAGARGFGDNGDGNTETPLEDNPKTDGPPEVGEENNEDAPENDDGESPCAIVVTLTYLNPTSIGKGCGGPCKDDEPDRVGLACNGDFIKVEYGMGSYADAERAVREHEAAYENARCKASLNNPIPWVGNGIKVVTKDATYINSPPPPGTCSEIVTNLPTHGPLVVSGGNDTPEGWTPPKSPFPEPEAL